LIALAMMSLPLALGFALPAGRALAASAHVAPVTNATAPVRAEPASGLTAYLRAPAPVAFAPAPLALVATASLAAPASPASEPAPAGFAKPNRTVAAAPLAYYKWFEYTGHDSVFDQPLPAGNYRNPVLAGFHPDPSITRVGNTFYLVNSTFTYFPGIPVFQSADLVHWRQIGNVIDRPKEVSFDGLGVSRGLFAPTIRFHDGLFYVVCTSVDAGGNFLSVARDPAGPWSDPIWLPQLDGIDPSLFFDSDGKAYLLNNGPPVGPPKYDGHRAIWIQEFDSATRKLVGPRKVLIDGGVDFSKHPAWIEGPHMYRHDGWYILMCAEGGTSTQHSEVVLRSRSPWGPFKPFAGNPILTQRDLPADRSSPIANAGHADLVEAGDGSWWAVFLASRPYEVVHYNTGRETFLLPVTWRDGWPSILAPGKAIPYVAVAPAAGPIAAAAPTAAAAAPLGPAPPTAAGTSEVSMSGGRLPEPTTGNFTWRDEFDSAALKPQWLYVRVPKQPWIDLTRRPGWLAIYALRTPLDSQQNMSFLARRQQHLAFDASTELEIPAEKGIAVGLAAFQNENYWYFLAVRRRASARELELFLEKRGGKRTETIARTALDNGTRVKLKIAANARAYSFYFDEDGAGWKPLRENDDGSILSTDVAGGFVGAFIGPYARAE
jgi:xylan 1,4-beta-xylosidase